MVKGLDTLCIYDIDQRFTQKFQMGIYEVPLFETASDMFNSRVEIVLWMHENVPSPRQAR